MTTDPGTPCEPDFRRFFQGSPHPYLVLCTDPDFTIVAVNDRYLEVTGTKREKIIGRGLFVVFPDNPLEAGTTSVSDLRASLDRVLRDRTVDIMGIQKYDIPVRGQPDRFELKYWSPVNTPIFGPEGDIAYILHHVEDITAFIKRFELLSGNKAEPGMKVENATQRMEAEVLRRATEVKDINRKLKAAMEALEARTTELETVNRKLDLVIGELESFSYSVSHDLRAPLRALDGFSEAILEDYGDKLDPPGKDYLNRIRAASQYMGRLIDDLLHLSRVTRKELKREPINLNVIAESIIDDLKRRDPGRKVIITIKPGMLVHADQDLLRAVLQNLLDNAWKFTSKKPEAIIEFGSVEKEGKTVYYVRDNGAGFDMAYAGKLFGAFQRLHSTEEFPGTGIGLATAQRIIHKHGGQIWAEGEVGKGATFYFTLS
ncbi:ATP-binding protein [Methanocella sp. MCL-LM]|uniref:PAS domain-containing sensor histidine kinase n=1 Tax=Methanocella sp. MCL-LM TaxID=3412035 RepID=UPI003C735BB4